MILGTGSHNPLSCASESADDVLNVRFPPARKTASRVRAVYAAEFFDNDKLDGLRVAIVAAIIRGTSTLGTDLDPSPMTLCIPNRIIPAIVLLRGGELSLPTALPNSIVPTAINGIIVVAAGDDQGIGKQNSVFEDSHV